MIECIINGQKTLPSLSNGLKLVIENPAMRDKSSYTYDIVFPLDIPQNVKFFSHVGHMSVSVKQREYESCRLVADNKTLFQGKGIVTNVSQSEVKMQIVQEIESSFPDVFKDLYIDKITYPHVDSRFKQAVFDDGGEYFWNDDHGMTEYYNPKSDLENNKFIGERYKYTFVTTVPDGEDNQTGEAVENLVNVLCITGEGNDLYVEALYRLAVQPSLMFVLKKVLEAKGYTYDLSAIDVEPWNDLYIASAKKSLNIADALPHWTAEKFLQEIEKLFNVSFTWEGSKVTATRLWDQEASRYVSISAENEFERTYDEEGQEYADTSNLTYQLSDLHDGNETIAREVIEKFGIKSYRSETEMRTAVARMTEKEKKTSLFATADSPELFYWHESIGEEDSDKLVSAGVFRPLFRDVTADNERPLSITPVALEDDPIPLWAVIRGYRRFYDEPAKFYLIGGLPSCLPRPVVEVRETVEDYITVQDMVEDGSSEESKEDDSVMEVMFVGPNSITGEHFEGNWGGIAWMVRNYDFWLSRNVPAVHNYMYRFGLKAASLALNECNTMKCIGELHVSQLQIDNATGFNKNEETIVKFVSDTIPPIGSVYLIRNKRYIAKQLEVQLNDNGYAKEITGHFYEMDS